MTLSLEQAKALSPGTILYHDLNRNADNTPQRWRVNGKPKTWKTRLGEVRVPVKHGLYQYGYVTQDELDLVCLTEEEAIEARDTTIG